MKNRFYFPDAISDGTTIELAGDEFHHAVRVHRSRVGEEVELFDGSGNAFTARIETIGKHSATLTILRAAERRDPSLQIDLAMALIQPDRFELVLQKATELGVRRFRPMITKRSEVRPDHVNRKLDRWRKIIVEATKQSGRSVLPAIENPAEFSSLIRGTDMKVLLDADAEPGALASSASAILLLVGPEGGWTPEELEEAREAGCVFRRLGPRRLRAETAAIAGVTFVLMTFGDLR